MGFGHLNSRRADAGCAAMDQKGLARFQSRPLKHIGPDRQDGFRQGCRLK